MTRGKKVILAGITLWLCLCVTLVGLLCSAGGLHLIFNGMVRWVPGLQIGSVDGGWRNLTLKQLSYRAPGVSFQVKTFHFSLSPSCFIYSQVCINALVADDMSLDIDSHQLPAQIAPKKPATESSDFILPYPLKVNLLEINRLQVHVDGNAITLGQWRTAMDWQGNNVTILPTELTDLQVKLAETPPRQQAVTQPQGTLPEVLDKLFAKPLLPELSSLAIPVNVNVLQFNAHNLQWDHVVPIDTLQLTSVLVEKQRVSLGELRVNSAIARVSAQGDILLTGTQPVDIKADIQLAQPPWQDQQLHLLVNGQLQGKLTSTLDVAGTLRGRIQLDSYLAQAGMPLNLSVSSPLLSWPLGSNDAQTQVKDLKLSLNGKANDYALSLSGALSATNYPNATLSLQGQGNTHQFHLSSLDINTLQGKASLTGQLDWMQGLNWDSQLTLDGINTVKQWPQWPTTLKGHLAFKGYWQGNDWQLQFPVLALEGAVKQNRIQLTGSVVGNAKGNWDIPSVSLLVGRNKFTLQGKLAEQWQLDARLDAPRLDGVLPGLSGVVKGAVQLRGSESMPQLQADITASALQWQTLHIKLLSLKSVLKATSQYQGMLALSIENIQQGDLHIARLSLNTQGNEQQHHLILNVSGKPMGGQLVVNGRWDRNQGWRGQVTPAYLETPLGAWRLMQPIDLNYTSARQNLTLSNHCWQNGQSEVCFPKTIELGAQGQVGWLIRQWDTALLKPLLAPETRLEGRIQGQGRVSWQGQKGLPEIAFSLQGDQVAVHQHVQGAILPLIFEQLVVNANIRNNLLDINWMIKLLGNGQSQGKIQVSDPLAKRTLSGSVDISRISFSLLRPLLQVNEKSQGMINSQLRLGGNLNRPQLFGHLAVSDMELKSEFLPLNVEHGDISIDFNGISSSLSGVIKTSQGQLQLHGEADWPTLDGWRAKLAVAGERVRVALPAVVELDVSPNLVFDATPTSLSLDGRVNIPWARIHVQELPDSAVDVSSDEVMLDEHHQPIQHGASKMAINSHLIVNIGDDVRIDAFGLKARLNGALNLVQDQRGLGLNGQINIPSGRFHAYGQDLIIRKGHLLFSGPVEQPVLDLEAIRNPDSTDNNVVAGVRVTGVADAPKLEVFSDPTMSQQEALSYLLRGQGLASSGADSSAMTSMLVSLGVAQSGKLVGKIGEAFGVSNLALDTQGVGDNSQVVVSGYVLPGLQVKYGVGIFDSLATLTLRYRLMPKLYLEAVSGIDQALDLLYQFEF